MQKKLALVVVVLAALVGGCVRALPPIQTESSADYSVARCDAKETERERGDCYRERAKLAEQLLEAGAKSESHSATPASPTGAPQPSFIPSPASPSAPIIGMRYVVRRDPIGGNAENGCGGPMDLTLRNGAEDTLAEATDGGESLQPCGNGGSLIPIIGELKNGGVRIALVTQQGREAKYYHTLTGKRTVTVNAFAATPNAGVPIPADVLQYAMANGGNLPPGTIPQSGFVRLPNGIVLPTVPQMGHAYVSSGVFPVPGGRTLDVRDSHFGL